jgi:IPT/TIG domain
MSRRRRFIPATKGSARDHCGLTISFRAAVVRGRTVLIALAIPLCCLVFATPSRATQLIGYEVRFLQPTAVNECPGLSALCILTASGWEEQTSHGIEATESGTINEFELAHGAAPGKQEVRLAVLHPSTIEGHKVFVTSEISAGEPLSEAETTGQIFGLKEPVPIAKGDHIALIAPHALKVMVINSGGQGVTTLFDSASAFTQNEYFQYMAASANEELLLEATETVNSSESVITVSPVTPSQGATYTQGQVVDANFSCNDSHPVTKCSGTVPLGSPIDTGTTGEHTFTVSGADELGNGTEVTVTYTVNPSSSSLPTITAVKPKSRSVAGGGKAVTITGTNFTGATGVTFGTIAATSYEVVNATTIKAVPPAEPAGLVDVHVGNGAGTSSTTKADHFKFYPVVGSVSPPEGPAAGGTVVTVKGKGFGLGKTASVFKFGTTKATSVNCPTSTECTMVAPAHVAELVNVKVTVNKVSSPKAPANEFTYF